MAKGITTADLKHRIVLCSTQDDIANEVMLVSRKDAFHAWAAITPKKASAYIRDGVTVNDTNASQTHEIYIRYRRDFSITAAAWVYEARGKSPARWYKVLGVTDVDEKGLWWCLKCHLSEASDEASTPTPGNSFITDTLPRGAGL